METNSKNRWQVRVAALVIFVLGFAAGALSLNLYRRYRSTDAPAPRAKRFDRLLDRLNLSAQQRTEVEKIMRDTRAELAEVRKQSQPQFVEVRRRSRERIEKALSEEQWKQLQEMMKKNRDRRQQQSQDEQ
jgi:hypothetical protein